MAEPDYFHPGKKIKRPLSTTSPDAPLRLDKVRKLEKEDFLHVPSKATLHNPLDIDSFISFIEGNHSTDPPDSVHNYDTQKTSFPQPGRGIGTSTRHWSAYQTLHSESANSTAGPSKVTNNLEGIDNPPGNKHQYNLHSTKIINNPHSQVQSHPQHPAESSRRTNRGYLVAGKDGSNVGSDEEQDFSHSDASSSPDSGRTRRKFPKSSIKNHRRACSSSILQTFKDRPINPKDLFARSHLYDHQLLTRTLGPDIGKESTSQFKYGSIYGKYNQSWGTRFTKDEHIRKARFAKLLENSQTQDPPLEYFRRNSLCRSAEIKEDNVSLEKVKRKTLKNNEANDANIDKIRKVLMRLDQENPLDDDTASDDDEETLKELQSLRKFFPKAEIVEKSEQPLKNIQPGPSNHTSEKGPQGENRKIKVEEETSECIICSENVMGVIGKAIKDGQGGEEGSCALWVCELARMWRL